MARAANQFSLDLISLAGATTNTTTVHFNLGTVPFKIADFTPATNGQGTIPAGVRRICLTNKHATNYMALGFSGNTTSPVFVASGSGTTATTEGMPVLPGSQLFLNVKNDVSVWVVANGISTPFQLTSFDLSLGLGG